MICIRIINGDNKICNTEIWDDVLYKAEKVEHLKKLNGEHKPYTDMFKVVLEGVESIYLVELPTW